jgi:hypothetical protein
MHVGVRGWYGGQRRTPKRQYLGCAGKVANGIKTVHLAYVREGTGHALIGAGMDPGRAPRRSGDIGGHGPDSLTVQHAFSVSIPP